MHNSDCFEDWDSNIFYEVYQPFDFCVSIDTIIIIIIMGWYQRQSEDEENLRPQPERKSMPEVCLHIKTAKIESMQNKRVTSAE